jgi:hypothetical protein
VIVIVATLPVPQPMCGMLQDVPSTAYLSYRRLLICREYYDLLHARRAAVEQIGIAGLMACYFPSPSAPWTGIADEKTMADSRLILCVRRQCLSHWGQT